MSQAFHVVSARPALTSLPRRTSRQPQQPRIREEALDDLPLVHPQVAHPRVAVGTPVRVEQCPGTQPLDEPAELARRDRLAPEVDEVDLEPALLEEPDRGPRRLVVLEAEDLDAAGNR